MHDIEMPPVITANFVVQPLHRWNGAMRIVPWPEMAAYLDEVVKMDDPWAKSNTKSPRFIQDQQTYKWKIDDLDLEIAPDLGHEFERRRQWLGHKIFPLEAGDVLIRDSRVWHGGCPNLSSEARYLPAVEASSKGMVEFFAGRGKEYPKPSLPGEHFKLLSQRAQKLCSGLAVQEDDGYLSKHLDDFSWLMWSIGAPARRNHFMPGLQLNHDQIEAISLRACLEQMIKAGKLVNEEQAASFQEHLTKLSAGSKVDVGSGSSASSLCSELCTLLSQKPGPWQHVFAANAIPGNEPASMTVDGEIAAKAATLLSSL